MWRFPFRQPESSSRHDIETLYYETHSEWGIPYLRKHPYGSYMNIKHRLVLTYPGHLILNTMVNVGIVLNGLGLVEMDIIFWLIIWLKHELIWSHRMRHWFYLYSNCCLKSVLVIPKKLGGRSPHYNQPTEFIMDHSNRQKHRKNNHHFLFE